MGWNPRALGWKPRVEDRMGAFRMIIGIMEQKMETTIVYREILG